jgi:broad specificity phosphatase PhoE
VKTLVLVRHGETEGNSSIRYYGDTDIELSELGRAQMRASRCGGVSWDRRRRFSQVRSAALSKARGLWPTTLAK